LCEGAYKGNLAAESIVYVKGNEERSQSVAIGSN